MLNHTFSVAPMMDWTDRHCRALHRRLSRCALLYTEMVTADAVVHGDRERLLGYSPEEHPVALQLGGSDPDKLKEASKVGEEFGYDEINLNCGCPSDRVQSGAFGAVLMKSPERVAECVAAMQDAVSVPVTVKCRIGVDEDDPYEVLPKFIDTVSDAGCELFIIHARKAWLQGLSPKENRDIPPLDYSLVKEIKRTNPELIISLNGGVETLDEAEKHLAVLDGVMLGRAAYHSPELLFDVDQRFFGEQPVFDTLFDALADYREYILRQLEGGVPLHGITRHMLGLFAGKPGARKWRRYLSENAPGATGVDAIEIFDVALAEIPKERLSAA